MTAICCCEVGCIGCRRSRIARRQDHANADEARDWQGEWERDLRMDDA